jgi:hypothetical protein
LRDRFPTFDQEHVLVGTGGDAVEVLVLTLHFDVTLGSKLTSLSMGEMTGKELARPLLGLTGLLGFNLPSRLTHLPVALMETNLLLTVTSLSPQHLLDDGIVLVPAQHHDEVGRI